MKSEPVAVLSAINAVIALGVGFGFHVTPEQMGLITAAVTTILAVVMRSRVTPAP